MNKSHKGLNGFQGILEQKRTELARGLQRRDEIAIEKSADLLDEIQLASERELAIRNADREAVLLRDVRAALHRLQDGSYGICVECEEEIGPKRLAAVPWASRCVRCQEISDRQGESSADSFSEVLVSAS